VSGVERFLTHRILKALGMRRGSAAGSSNGGVELVDEFVEAPRVDVPEHVIGEVTRGLINIAVEALRGRDAAKAWVRLEPYRTAAQGSWPGLKTTALEFLRASGSTSSNRSFRRARAASDSGSGYFWPRACWICMMAESAMRPGKVGAQAS